MAEDASFMRWLGCVSFPPSGTAPGMNALGVLFGADLNVGEVEVWIDG